jgi:phenylacetate-CoA ligase
MFETGVRQFRLALGMAQGRRLNPRNVERLVDDVLATLGEFGEAGADAAELIDGPMTNPADRLEVTNNSLRRTARRLAAQSPFYARHFSSAQIDPAKLDVTGLRAIPVTVKADLIERPGDFRCTDVPAYLATRTTGTTGRPAEVWLSRYEMELWPALGALASVLRGGRSRVPSARHRASGGSAGQPGRGGRHDPADRPQLSCRARDGGPARRPGRR